MLSLEDITEENYLSKLLMSIEPELPKITISKDKDWGVRYGNFVTILDAVSSYISHHRSKSTFSPSAEFKKLININEVIQRNKSQCILLFEMVIFISSISSNRDHIDILLTCNEQYMDIYLSVVEKYKIMEEDFSIMYSRYSSSLPNTKGKEDLLKEIDEKTNQYNTLQKQYYERDRQYKDCSLQLENLKKEMENTRLIQEDILNEKEKNTQLQIQIQEMKFDFDSKKKDYEERIKTLNFKYSKANDKVISLESTLDNYKSYAKENERLKNKIKGLNELKDKDVIISQLEKTIESKNRSNEKLIKNNKELAEKINSLNSQIGSQNDKIRELSRIKQELEIEIDELKRNNKRMDDIIKKEANRSINKEGGINLGFLEQENNDQEIEELNNQINEANKKIEQYEETIIHLNLEKEKVTSEKDKIFFEKEKYLNDIQKIELEKQKIEIECEEKIKQLNTELLKYKSDSLSNPTTESNEIQKLKAQIAKQNELIEALKNKLNKSSDSDDIIKDPDDKIEDNKVNKSEIMKLNGKIEEYKKNEEEYKERVQQEHDLISSSFYELALQFVSLKEKYINREMNSQFGTTWIEIERKKNFPF